MAHNKRMGIRAGKLLGRRSSGDLGDGGDAARAGGKGSGVVAGGVLDGVGVVAGGGVGVGVCYGAAFRGRWRSDGSRRAPVWSIRRRVRLSCRPVPSPKGVKPQPER